MERKVLSFEEENNILLNKIINAFYSNWYQHCADQKLSLELMITSKCNQNCEYCYLIKNEDKLYPVEFRDEKLIKKNLKILLNFYLKKGFKFQKIDLFSGEIWGTRFGFEILFIILDFVKQGLIINNLVIPSNCSFILSESSLNLIQKAIDEFKLYNTNLIFSASVDGLILDKDTRPFKNEAKNTLKNEEFYDKLGRFLSKNNYGIHPMVSAYGIEKWIENYDWWKQWHQKYFQDHLKIESCDWFYKTMFLEVRNDDWTEEKILFYLKFLKHMLKDNFIFYKNQGATLLDYFLDLYERIISCKVKNNNNLRISIRDRRPSNYDPLNFSGPKYSPPQCAITRNLIVRLGDLSIVPCHRTSYEKFIYGKYIIQEDQNLTIKAFNPLLANKIYRMNYNTNPNCNNCLIADFCVKGCYGSQYESTGDLFTPIESVCEFYKVKFIFVYNTLLFMLNQEEIKNNLIDIDYSNLSEIYNLLLQEEKYQKWEKIIQNL